MADFNSDGILDAAAAGESGIWLFTGKGAGAFNTGVLAAAMFSANAGLATADFKGDHKVDLVVTLPFAGTDGSGAGFVVLFGNGNGRNRAAGARACFHGAAGSLLRTALHCLTG